MPVHPDQHDLIPDTPTAAALRRTVLDSATVIESADDPKRRFREIEIDPDDPKAPHCAPPVHIIVDPDDPKAPHCKPRRYIEAPDTAPEGAKTMPAWVRQFGTDLAETFDDRA